jgi:hypothetical protein
MTCQQIDDFLDRRWQDPQSRLPEDVISHLEGCARCRGLVDWAQGRSPQPTLPGGLESRVEKTILESLRPVSPLPSAGVFTLAFLGVFVLVLLVGVWARGGVYSPGVMTARQLVTISAILAAGAVVLAASLSAQIAPGSRTRIPPKALVLSVAGALLVALAVLFPWTRDATFWSWGVGCLLFGLRWAVLAAILLSLLIRRGAALFPSAIGATTGLFAGLVGVSVIHLGCLNVTAPHLAIWHAAVPLSSALVGFTVGSVLGWKASPDDAPRP